MIWMAAVGAASAAWLVGARPQSPKPAAAYSKRHGPHRTLLLLVPVAFVVATLPVEAMLLAGIGTGLALAVWQLVRRRLALARAGRRAGQVLSACDSIAGDLGVGLTQRVALDRVAGQWHEFAPVAAAARLDADVAGELRRVACLPGAGELGTLAAAWQVSHRSGAGLAATLAGVADVIRADLATARLVQTELAAARATANLLIALPAGVLLLGSGLGTKPWGFLTGSPIGLGCLAVGLALDLAGVWWLQAISAKVLRS